MAPLRIPEIARPRAGGADELTVINSIGMSIDVHTRRSGSPSHGRSVRPAVHHRRPHGLGGRNAVDIPICGVGGVMTGEDAAGFILAGACCISVGMAFVEPDASVRILHELEAWVESQGVKDINELIGAFEC
ncbi:MAG: hypothetical protein ACLTKG_02415 [Collinsella intestinalis]